MTHIRPYQLFGLLDFPPAGRTAEIMLPFRRAAGGTTLLETALLVCAARIVSARRIFEFGTYWGSNTYNLALNVPENGTVYTLDLEDSTSVQHEADTPFAEAHLAAPKLDFVDTPQERKVQRLRGNSRNFDFSRYHGSIDLVFIDGGHDLETVRSDTEAASAMLSAAGPSCLVWHDYGNRDYPELTAYLDEIARGHPLIHVEDTMLCFWFTGVNTHSASVSLEPLCNESFT